LERFGEESLSESDHVASVAARAGTSGELNTDDAVGCFANPRGKSVLSERGSRDGADDGERHRNVSTDK
jgi:hypothetical protein